MTPRDAWKITRKYKSAYALIEDSIPFSKEKITRFTFYDEDGSIPTLIDCSTITEIGHDGKGTVTIGAKSRRNIWRIDKAVETKVRFDNADSAGGFLKNWPALPRFISTARSQATTMYGRILNMLHSHKITFYNALVQHLSLAEISFKWSEFPVDRLYHVARDITQQRGYAESKFVKHILELATTSSVDDNPLSLLLACLVSFK